MSRGGYCVLFFRYTYPLPYLLGRVLSLAREKPRVRVPIALPSSVISLSFLSWGMGSGFSLVREAFMQLVVPRVHQKLQRGGNRRLLRVQT